MLSTHPMHDAPVRRKVCAAVRSRHVHSSRMRRSRRRWALFGVALTAMLLGTYVYVRLLPAYSEDEIDELQAQVDEMRARTAAETCSRSSYGSAEPADEHLSALFDDAEIGDCLINFQREGRDALYIEPETDTHAWHWDLDRGDDEGGNLPPGHAQLAPSSPIPPIDSEPPDVVSECMWLTERIDRFAARTDLCSPLGPTHPDWMGDMMWGIGLGHAVAALARWRARDGYRFRSFEEALRGIVVIRDLRRGPTSLILAMIGVAAEGIVVAQLMSFLFDEPGFTDEQYTQLDRTIEQILADRIGAGIVMRTDRFAAVDNVMIGARDELGAMLDYTASFDTRWCPDDARPTECIDAVRAMPPLEPRSELTELLLGPRFVRGHQLRAAVRESMSSFSTYLARMQSADTSLRQLRVLLRLSQQRARGGGCPPRIDEEHFQIDVSDDPFELTQYSGAQYELVAPPLRVMPTFERIVMLFLCPAATPAWLPIETP